MLLLLALLIVGIGYPIYRAIAHFEFEPRCYQKDHRFDGIKC